VSAATLAAPSPASAATNNCTIAATTPALIPDPLGAYVAGGGKVSCSSSAETITVHVEVHRIDNTFFPIDDPLIGDSTVTRRPGYQLLSLELVRSPRCRAGFSYYSDVTGSARWKTGSMSGRAISPTMIMC
jgi:hypothetical protein